MTNVSKKRLYLDTDIAGNKFATIVVYDLVFNKDGLLVNVFNEYGNSVSKQSECWQYYDSLYNNL